MFRITADVHCEAKRHFSNRPSWPRVLMLKAIVGVGSTEVLSGAALVLVLFLVLVLALALALALILVLVLALVLVLVWV